MSPAGLAVVEVQEGADKDAEDGAAEAVVPGKQVAQAVGEAQHPLADGDVGQHTIHEAGGTLGHAPAAATGAEAAAAELLLHEPGQADALGAAGRLAEKGLQSAGRDNAQREIRHAGGGRREAGRCGQGVYFGERR